MEWRIKFKSLAAAAKSRSFAAAAAAAFDHPVQTKSFANQQPLLTPQIVLATLRACPSHLTALSFFLWCARQPHYFHDKPTFHHMVTVLSTLSHTHGTVRGILRQLETVGCLTKPQTLLLFMRIYWCGAMHDMVFQAFQEMTDSGYIPNTYARNIVMDVLFKIKRVDAALRLLHDSPAPNFLTFNIAISNLCRLNRVDNVKRVLRCMLTEGYYMNHPETYALVLNCFCKFARFQEAWQLLAVMSVLGLPFSVNIWSILINGFCKAGQIEVAANLLEKMVRLGCSPNIVTCTSLIKGFLESRMPGKAFEILASLESKGCFPDLVLCNVLIDCLSKMGWCDDAFEVFSSLRERRLTPDVYTFSSLVSAICLSRQYVLLPLLTSGLSIQPDLVVCNCLLSYFCKAGHPAGAVEFYNDMIDRGFLPDKYTYAGVLSALCRLGRTNEAINVYHGIMCSYAGMDAHIHTIMINGLMKSGRIHKAMKLFRKATAEMFPLDVASYNVAIDGLIRAGQREEAYALFSQMKEMDVAPNKRVYNLILSSFCEDRDVVMIKHVLREMVDRKVEINCHTYKLMKNVPLDSSDSHLASNIFFELRNLGLLPKVDNGAYASFNSRNDSGDVVDFGTSSSDLSDAAVSAC